MKITLHIWSEPCGLDVTISPCYDWSVARQSTSFTIRHWNLRNLTLQTCLSITRDFFRLHSTFARLYNPAASPASRLRSAGSLATIPSIWSESMLQYLSVYLSQREQFWKLGNILGCSTVLAGNFRYRDVFSPIARKRKYLMDYKYRYQDILPKHLKNVSQAMRFFSTDLYS